MAVTLTGTNGLFTRLGKLFKIVDRVNTHQADGTAGLAKEIQDVLDEYDTADNDHALALTGVTEQVQREAANVYRRIQIVCQKTLVEMFNDDNPLPSKSVDWALERLIDQMISTSKSVNAASWDTALASSDGLGGSITGTGTVIRGLINGRGENIQNMMTDKIKFTCTKDSQYTGTIGRETFSVESKAAISDIRDPLYPQGFGLSGRITVSDATRSATHSPGRNLLTNSDFEDFATTDTPDNWTIVTGAAGTGIKESSTVLVSAVTGKSLNLVGDSGGTLLKMTQTFDTSGQTSSKLKPETVYCISGWIKGQASLTGTIRFCVTDGSGTILTSVNGNSFSKTFDLSTASTSTFTHVSGVFATPRDVPSTVKFQMDLTVAMANTKNCYIDQLQLLSLIHI